MPTEREWVASLIERLEKSINGQVPERRVSITDQQRLPYAYEVQRYRRNEPAKRHSSEYRTDILIFDDYGNDEWIPRVVIEAKLGGVTTHDALTYSSKSSTHKQVHPYLRYGVLIGNMGDCSLPARLFRHGAHFDFMMKWYSLDPIDSEWKSLVSVLIDEITASRNIQVLLTTSRQRDKKNYGFAHRPLRLGELPTCE